MNVKNPFNCPNGRFHQSHDIDGMVRKYNEGLGLLGGYSGKKVFIQIEYFGGFEAFNTRAYHNYETWGHGWKIRILACEGRRIGRPALMTDDLEKPIEVTNECLVCGVEEALRKLDEEKKKNEGGKT